MKHLLILTAFVLGLTLTTVGQGSEFGEIAFAYEFSEHERQVEADGRQQRLQSQQQLDNAMQAERQQQDQRWQREQRQFDPRAYDPPAPYNMYQNGKTSVCRRGANGAVFCN